MSKSLVASILLLLVFITNGHCQIDDDQELMLTSKEFRPSIGFGIGMLNYYGEVNSNGNHGAFHNQLGYSIHVGRKITDYADLGFSFLTGTVIGNERSLDRNLNFKTNIYSGSIYVSYNFYHFLPEAAILQPYVTIGFESFEYNNKADLVDASGNKYFYWNDGTIRSLDQNSPFANQAVVMQRDYVYETDLRSANLDGLGKYPQLAIGIPLGVGANLNVTDRMNFKIGSTFHFTFTDLIDNVSTNGVGVREGNAMPDFFMFNSVSLHYDLINTPKRVNPEDFIFPDYFVLDMVDGDQDGVVDGLDICPFTPEGVEVDANGCALDDDDDGVPNYQDIELTTNDTNFVGDNGKTLTDEDFQNWYLRYIDSADVPIDILYKIAGEPRKSATYRILLGEFSGRLPEDLAESFLAEGDVIGALTKGNRTAYLAGKYGELEAAKRRKQELLAKGMPQATIVVWEGKEFFTLKEWEERSNKEIKERFKDEIKKKESLNGMYAVKLGETPADAHSSDKVKFFEYEDVVVLKGDKNSNDYVVGPFIDSVGATQVLQEVDRSKFPNATIVKVSDGKAKKSGIDVKNIPTKSNPKGAQAWNRPKDSKKETQKVLSKLEDAFVIDFGNKKDPKTKAIEAKIKAQPDVVEIVDPVDGNTKYITKNPKTKQQAAKEVEKLKKQGVSTAKIAQVKGGKIIPVKPGSINSSKQESILRNLEDAFVIDFGSKKDPKTKALEAKIKSQPDIVEVVDPVDGNTKYITSNPKTQQQAVKEVEKLVREGVSTAKVAQVKEGRIVPVKQSQLNSNDQETILKDLENAYVIDFGDKKDPATKSLEAKIKSQPGVVEVIDPVDGKTKYITSNPKTQQQAVNEVEKLKKDGVTTAQVAQVKGGKIIPVKTGGLNQPKQENILRDLENSFVIDFGSKKDPKTKAVEAKIKAQPDVIEVVDPKDGKTKYITSNPKTQEQAIKEVQKLKSEGVSTAQVAQVKGGQIVPFKEAKLNNETQEDLTKLENEFVVKLGTIDNSTPMIERQKLLSAANSIQVKNPDGTVDVITKSSYSQEQPAHKVKASLKKQGFNNAKVAYVREGKVEVLKKEELDGKFTLSLGSFKSNVPNDEVNKIASISDVESMETFNPNMTTYTVGNFDDPEEAKRRMTELVAQGFTPELVKYEDGKIKVVDIGSVFDQTTINKLNELKNSEGIVKTGDVVFRVQLGAYRGKINETVFGGIKTLAFPSQGGITKYVTGSFGTYQQAYVHKLEIRSKGFNGAFVVAYKDGKRISVTDLVNNEKYKKVKESVSPIEKKLKKVEEKPKEPKPEVTSNQDNSSSNNSQVNTKKSISYRVQIGAYKDDAVQDQLTVFPDVTMEVYGQYKRYVSGNFNTYKEASAHKETIKAKGFKGAFVVAYKGNERVAAPGENPNVIKKTDLQDNSVGVKSPQENNPGSPSESNYDKNKLQILVQVGLYRGNIPPDLQTLFNTLPNITKQVTPHGVIRYMTGDFKNPSEAAAYKEELVKQGFDGAFLVAYYDNERIKIQKAIEIFQSN